MNRREQVTILTPRDHRMIVVLHRHLGFMQVTLMRENYPCLALALTAIQHLAQFGALGLEFFELGWDKFDLPPRIGDTHGCLY
jgi:hypothetical protein